MEIGICSFSFHRLMASPEHDIFWYMQVCHEMGCTQLDPWNAHLLPPEQAQSARSAGRNPGQSHNLLPGPDDRYVDRISSALGSASIPVGTIAVDGAHIYEPTVEARRQNRTRAYQWLDAAHLLGARQVRIDAGGPEEMPDDVLRIIIDGYHDLIDRAGPKGIEILIENHWGPSVVPENVLRLLEAAPGLGLLYDTRNWKPGTEEGRRRCARFARATHVKTRRWDTQGKQPDEDAVAGIRILQEAGYRGVWGIESVPEDGDELQSSRWTIDLLRRLQS